MFASSEHQGMRRSLIRVRTSRVIGALLILSVLPSTVTAAAVSTFTPKVFVYGEIYDRHSPVVPAGGVSANNLVGHLGWLREHDYQVIAARDLGVAGRVLSERQVILVFTGSVGHFNEVVFPVLEIFGVPAVLALSKAGLRDPGSGAALRALAASERIDFALDAARVLSAGEDLARYLRDVRDGVGHAHPDWVLWRGAPFRAAVIDASRSAGYRGIFAEGPSAFVHPAVYPAYPLRSDPDAGALIEVFAERGFRHGPLRGIRVPARALVDERGRIDQEQLSRTAVSLARIEPTAVFVPAYLPGVEGRQARILLFPNRTTGNNRSLPEIIARLAVPVYAIMPAAIAAEQRDRAAAIYRDLAAGTAIRGVLLDRDACLGPCPAPSSRLDPGVLARLAGELKHPRRDVELIWTSADTDGPMSAAIVDRFLVRDDTLCRNGKAALWRRLGKTGGYDGTILEFTWQGGNGSPSPCIDMLRAFGVRHYSLSLPRVIEESDTRSIAHSFSRRTFPYIRNDL